MMRLVAVACVAILLAGCGEKSGSQGAGAAGGSATSGDRIVRFMGNPNEPTVSVVEDNGEVVILVDQEPVFHKKNAADKKTTWTLDLDSKQNWNLVDVAVGPELSDGHTAFTGCAPVGAAGDKFRCDNDGHKGLYKYTIKVKHRTSGTEIKSPDPFIRNG